jgi:4-amino-4-deoxy-L-arabinose transferase-like glycosyltransferase
MKFSRRNIYLIAISVLFLALGASSIPRHSLTADEACHHIASGYVFLTQGDFAFSTEVPPLSRYIVAAPLLFMDLKLPVERSFWVREDRGEFSREFLFKLNRDKLAAITFFSRFANIMVGLFGGLFLFFWSEKRFGTITACLASFFYFLLPETIAHSSLATTDIAAAVFIMCSVLTFWDFLERPSLRTCLVAAFFLGLGLLSKLSAILLCPIYLVIVIGASIFLMFSKRRGEAFRLIGLFLLFIVTAKLVLWAGYGFETKPLLQGVLRAEEKAVLLEEAFKKLMPLVGDEGVRKFTSSLYTVPVPLSSFATGVMGIFKHGGEGSAVFFMGNWNEKGTPFYYIFALLIKTPIPLIMCFLAGLLTAFRRGVRSALNVYLLLVAAVFVVMASISNLQLGIRYILPAMPLLILIASQGAKAFIESAGVKRVVGYTVLFWFLAESVLAAPGHLSYFNEFVGGRSNGYKYLRDSNLDWGQDLPALRDLMKKDGIDEVGIYYFGGSDPEYYGIKSKPVTEAELAAPGKKVYAISAQYLDAVKWAKGLKPSARAGASIFVYDMRE